MISPLSTMVLAALMPMMDLAVTDLPEPLSPTMARGSPSFRSKLMPRTALTLPLLVRKDTRRSFTSNTLLMALSFPRPHRVYSSAPRSEGLKASRNPLPKMLKQISKSARKIAGKNTQWG